jgi:hypothetical protein
MRRLSVLAFALVFILPAYPADKKLRAGLVKLPPATAALAELTLVKPKQPCLNWSWASAIQTLLARQKVEVDQTDLILKADLGRLCIDKPVDLFRIKEVLEGLYSLREGGTAGVQVIVTPDAPTDVGSLILHMRRSQPLLMTWRGRPLVLQAVEYDEYIYPNSQRMFEVRKLTFADPLGDQPVIFDKLVDDPSEIGGVLDVVVTR